MQHVSLLRNERKAVTAACGLIIGAIDRQTGIVTEQESADCAMADEQRIAY
jgi:hypothetical protein